MEDVKRVEWRQEPPADASKPNLRLTDPSLTRAVTGSKTAIVAIGNADIQKAPEQSIVLKEIGAEPDLFFARVELRGEREAQFVLKLPALERGYPNTHLPDRRSGRITREGAGIG
jgi:hypothetical protein